MAVFNCGIHEMLVSMGWEEEPNSIVIILQMNIG